MEILNTVLKDYGIINHSVIIEPIKQGLINDTWKVIDNENEFILQKINDKVFKSPADIAHNISLIAEYLQTNHPYYFFVDALYTSAVNSLVHISGSGYFRMFPFVKNSHTIDTVQTPNQAYEAARQFGQFTKNLQGIELNKLKITIPSFHDLSLRYSQFVSALKNGNKERIHEADELIKQLFTYNYIVDTFEKIKQDPSFIKRVTHHDTKISNVLFDANEKGICVIDLDTVMAGYFISDVGDMMRTYLSPVSEEETDVNKIEIRIDFYKAIEQGYLSEMNNELSGIERDHFFFAGTYMIYMQALRFLTDYLLDDVYYGARYKRQNLLRALNQAMLLTRLLEMEGKLKG